MKLYSSILVTVLILPLMDPTVSHDDLIQSSQATATIEFCNKRYKNPKNKALFQDIRILTLNCDSTFSFNHSSCISRDSSFGRWSIAGSYIYLKPNKDLKNRIEKRAVLKNGQTFIDLSYAKLTYKNSYIVWERTPTWTDTLYKE